MKRPILHAAGLGPALCALLLCAPLAVSCARQPGTTLRIASQYGLAYLPLVLLQVEGSLDAALENAGLPPAEWLQTGNATTIREAMLAGKLDIGFMGLPPFLIGADKGTAWRLFTGLSEAPLGLVSLSSERRTLADFGESDRIALPQPGSIQHILLAMAAERQLGDADRFDDRLVSMGHPEGLAALLTRRDITAHFTAPPYLERELEEPDATLVLSGTEAFGGTFTFIGGVVAPGWPLAGAEAAVDRERLAQFRIFIQELGVAIRRIADLQVAVRRSELSEADRELLLKFGQLFNLPQSDLLAQLADPALVFSTSLTGLEDFAVFMRRKGMIALPDTSGLVYRP